jgi:glutamate carboxypeptidase
MIARLTEYFDARRERMLDRVRALVEHESPTFDAVANRALAASLGDELLALGARIRLHPTAHGAHLVADATFGKPADSRPILLLGHFDTIWPAGTLARRPFRVEGDRAWGPGIFDMKSGVAVILATLGALRDLGLEPRHAVRVLLTCDEEGGSPTSRDLIEVEAAGCAAAFVLEPPLPGGAAKTSRKGFAIYELRAHGVAAHSGLEPEKGVSATTELAHQVLALARLSNPRRGITVNVGVIAGGTRVNVVAAEARAEVDVRFRTLKQASELARAIESLAPVLDGSRLELRGGLNRPPLERTPAVVALHAWARRIAEEIGFDLGEGESGGASDGNFTGALGIPTLDGLGVLGDGAHAEHEQIVVGDLPRRAALLTALVAGFGAATVDTASEGSVATGDAVHSSAAND